MMISLDEVGIPPFTVTVEYRWERKEKESTLLGCELIACSSQDDPVHLKAFYDEYRDRDSGAAGAAAP
jgi:hypothetical protein